MGWLIFYLLVVAFVVALSIPLILGLAGVMSWRAAIIWIIVVVAPLAIAVTLGGIFLFVLMALFLKKGGSKPELYLPRINSVRDFYIPKFPWGQQGGR